MALKPSKTFEDHVMVMFQGMDDCLIYGLAFSSSIVGQITDGRGLNNVDQLNEADKAFQYYMTLTQGMLVKYLDKMNDGLRMYHLGYDKNAQYDGFVSDGKMHPVPKDNFIISVNEPSTLRFFNDAVAMECERQFAFYQAAFFIRNNAPACFAEMTRRQQSSNPDLNKAWDVGMDAGRKYWHYTLGTFFKNGRYHDVVKAFPIDGADENLMTSQNWPLVSAIRGERNDLEVQATPWIKAHAAVERLKKSVDGLRPNPFS